MSQSSESADQGALLQRVRAALPVVQEVAFLNTGYAGPLPSPVADAIHADVGRELDRGRSSPAEAEVYRERSSRLRERLARLIGAQSEEIALTRSTTEGVNVALWGMGTRPGDRILTTSLEHEGVRVPLWTMERRGLVEVERVDVGVGRRDETLAALERALERPARAVVFSHVAYSTGAVLPAAEIVDMAHRAGAWAIIDGAQAVGALPVDVGTLGADAYALSAHKWLCGPEGVGGLYVPERRWDRLQPTYTGFGSVQPPGRDPVPLAIGSGARRYELGSLFRPSISGLEAGLAWLEEIGWDWIWERTSRLSQRAAALLAEVPDCEPLLGAADHQGLVCVRLAGVHPQTITEELARQGIIVRFIRRPSCLRVSTGFFNTEEELHRLRDALARLLAS
jgi:L-cysteine/cystine lyase